VCNCKLKSQSKRNGLALNILRLLFEFFSADNRWRVAEFHIVLWTNHFNSESPDGTKLLHCYVSLLETLLAKASSTRLQTSPNLYFHVDCRTDRKSGYKDAGQPQPTCSDPFPIDSVAGTSDYSDVLMSTAYMFTETYEQLYDVQRLYVVLHHKRLLEMWTFLNTQSIKSSVSGSSISPKL
jgi:hypothetical protein